VGEKNGKKRAFLDTLEKIFTTEFLSVEYNGLTDSTDYMFTARKKFNASDPKGAKDAKNINV